MASTSQPQHYHEALPGQLTIDDAIAASIADEARQAPTGNGGPDLDEHPGKVIARIGKAMYGDLWHGKLAYDTGDDHRTLRRWESGECRPTEAKVSWIRFLGQRHIERIRRAIES